MPLISKRCSYPDSYCFSLQLHSPTESPTDPDLDAEAVFETIEQLLQSVSPQYDATRRSALIAKLESLQTTPEPA